MTQIHYVVERLNYRYPPVPVKTLKCKRYYDGKKKKFDNYFLLHVSGNSL